MRVGEIKTEADDVGAARRRLAWYEREAWAAARARGWRPARVLVALLLLMTVHNDELIARNSLLFRQRLPLRATALQALVDEPAAMQRRVVRAVALIDPRSRRSAWLRSTTVDGRRTRPPYRDYAEFMDRLDMDLERCRRAA